MAKKGQKYRSYEECLRLLEERFKKYGTVSGLYKEDKNLYLFFYNNQNKKEVIFLLEKYGIFYEKREQRSFEECLKDLEIFIVKNNGSLKGFQKEDYALYYFFYKNQDKKEVISLLEKYGISYKKKRSYEELIRDLEIFIIKNNGSLKGLIKEDENLYNFFMRNSDKKEVISLLEKYGISYKKKRSYEEILKSFKDFVINYKRLPKYSIEENLYLFMNRYRKRNDPKVLCIMNYVELG